MLNFQIEEEKSMMFVLSSPVTYSLPQAGYSEQKADPFRNPAGIDLAEPHRR